MKHVVNEKGDLAPVVVVTPAPGSAEQLKQDLQLMANCLARFQKAFDFGPDADMGIIMSKLAIFMSDANDDPAFFSKKFGISEEIWHVVERYKTD